MNSFRATLLRWKTCGMFDESLWRRRSHVIFATFHGCLRVSSHELLHLVAQCVTDRQLATFLPSPTDLHVVAGHSRSSQAPRQTRPSPLCVPMSSFFVLRFCDQVTTGNCESGETSPMASVLASILLATPLPL